MNAVVPADKLLTVQDIADRLQVHTETVLRWLREGQLEGFRLGSNRAGWRVSEDQLDAFLDARRRRGLDA